MSTQLLYLTDASTREFVAEVVGVDNDAVRLNRTAFYPGGGGQPADQGILRWEGGEVAVVSTGRKSGDVVHIVEGTPPETGTRIDAVLDWERRYALMRTHTALHILCAVVYRDFKSWVTGSNMKPIEARMDFEFDTLSAEFCKEN